MDKSEMIEFVLEVGSDAATEEELDRITRQLLYELRQTDIESAELVKGGPLPIGIKGDPATIGSIALVVLPAVLPKIVETVQSWLLCGTNRTVKFKGKINGNAINFEGRSEDLQRIIETFSKGKKKR